MFCMLVKDICLNEQTFSSETSEYKRLPSASWYFLQLFLIVIHIYLVASFFRWQNSCRTFVRVAQSTSDWIVSQGFLFFMIMFWRYSNLTKYGFPCALQPAGKRRLCLEVLPECLKHKFGKAHITWQEMCGMQCSPSAVDLEAALLNVTLIKTAGLLQTDLSLLEGYENCNF